MSLFSYTYKYGLSNLNSTYSTYRISDRTFSTILPEIKPSTVPKGTYDYLTDTHLTDLYSRNTDLFKDSSSKDLSVSIGEDYNAFLKNDFFTKLDLSSLLRSTSSSSSTFLNDYKLQYHTLLDLIGTDETEETEDSEDEINETGTFYTYGSDLDNVFRLGSKSSGEIDGKGGIDTLITNHPYSYYGGKNSLFNIKPYETLPVDYKISVALQHRNESTDVLEYRNLKEIERLEFTDKKLAFDLEDNAGVVAKVYGAVLGKDSISDPELIGSGLEQIDNGLSPENFAAIAIKSAGLFTHKDIVHALWNNVVGSEPTAAQANYYIDQLDRGEMDIGELGLYAANHPLNENNINLVGLQTNGIEFA